MATRKIEEYAHKYGLSNNAAKRRLGKRARSETLYKVNIARGAPVAGTGKSGKSSKGKNKLKA